MADQIDAQLKFAIKNNLNVLLSGKHGVGKTARVLSIFEQNKLNYRYFSASTMDPFTDFVGVPDKVIDQSTGEARLTYLRPEALDEENVEAMFFDEYNRAPKKVRNAVMELIQFKSINGRKFPKLKYIWTAINPDDDEDNNYDVEILDGAQSDRFHMHIDVPYEISTSYFLAKYPNGQGKAAIEWWKSLSKKQKNLVSPRRLDYGVEAVVDSSASSSILKTIFPKGINVKNFLEAVQVGSLKEQLIEAVTNGDMGETTRILNGSETRTAIKVVPEIVREKSKGDSKKFLDFCVDNMTDETLVTIVNEFDPDVRKLLSDKKHKKRLGELLDISSMDKDTKNKLNSILGNPVNGSSTSDYSIRASKQKISKWYGIDDDE